MGKFRLEYQSKRFGKVEIKPWHVGAALGVGALALGFSGVLGSGSTDALPSNSQGGHAAAEQIANCQTNLDELLNTPASSKPRTIHLDDGTIVQDSHGGGYKYVEGYGDCKAGGFDSRSDQADAILFIGDGNGTTFYDVSQNSDKPYVTYPDPSAPQLRAALQGH